MNYKFANPALIKKTNRRFDKIRKAYPNTYLQDFQIWEMVATIISGEAEKSFFDGDGIVVDGWNGYRNYTERNNPDPVKAWGGFYRTEKGQNFALCLKYAKAALENGRDAESAFADCAHTYGFNHWRWEPCNRKWGYDSIAEFYTEPEARQHEQDITQLKGYRRHTLELSEFTGMWRLRWETTRKPAQINEYQRTHRARIDA